MAPRKVKHLESKTAHQIAEGSGQVPNIRHHRSAMDLDR
jgi:hypothetical protein